ncbi:MAG: hypothetical protein WCN92_00445 [Eubacteriales bacterium]
MRAKFNIRTNALIILAHVYKNVDSGLKVNKLECESILDENLTKNDMIIAFKYLLEKKFITAVAIPSESITCTIEVNGIDWVEECLNIKPSFPTIE